VRYASASDAPIAIRYPNASESDRVRDTFYPSADYDNLGVRYSFDKENAPNNIIVAYGSMAERALLASDILRERGIDCGVVLAERIKPYRPLAEALAALPRPVHILFAEEGIKNGGAGMITYSEMRDLGDTAGITYDIAAIDDDFLSPKEPVDIYDYAGLTPERLAQYFQK
jgi:deoxyxylulose-5-phosphate synthase